ncbi:MAG: hypothetical protein R3359_06875, partial [Marinirhabdus sp.]|nr:hypothetical protein [Marinirhabdus sp.]
MNGNYRLKEDIYGTPKSLTATAIFFAAFGFLSIECSRFRSLRFKNRNPDKFPKDISEGYTK